MPLVESQGGDGLAVLSMARGGGTLTLPLLVCSVFGMVRAGMIAVAPTTDPIAVDSESCGSNDVPCASLQYGIMRAQPNDVVRLLPGEERSHYACTHSPT